MSRKKKTGRGRFRSQGKPVTRREFVAAGIGAAVGIALMGIRRTGEKSSFDVADGSTSGDRSPARAQRHNSRPGGLAADPKQMKGAYDIVVIGSGYGGAILGARLAGRGRSLAILERGKEWLPGDFPKKIGELKDALRHPTLNPLGLIEFNTPMKADLDVVAGCGLGGTSLINAAIASRPEDLVFEQKEWPAEIRAAHADGSLNRYYDKAEELLKPTVAPDADDMAKVRLHERTLAKLGVSGEKLRLNVNHGEANPLAPQHACTNCGDCCSGCNVGAKNTLQMNYLPLARSRGAEIYVGMEVTYLEKRERGWRIHYVYHPGGMEFWPHRGVIDARMVVLSAGSQGSTEILLRSHANGLSASRSLGTRMSANGDVLGFSYNGDTQTNIMGSGLAKDGLRPDWPAGQALMAYGDFRKTNTNGNLLERFLLIEGTVPTSLSRDAARLLAGWAGLHRDQFSEAQRARIEKDFMSWDPGSDGALNHSMLLLACGHDSSGGRYVHNGDSRPRVLWPGAHDEHSFQYINGVMKKYAEAQGGLFIPNPRSSILDHRLAATHPLGGCPMGDSSDTGVVDHAGRVFDGQGGTHEGLYVADGSIIPRSLGATPLMTISALSERIADLLLASQID